MGRSPCCTTTTTTTTDDANLKKGPWSPEEDQKLIDYINKHGHGNWKTLSKQAGLNRCGKSCRLRWANYLRPDIKRGRLSDEEERIVIHLHSTLGNKWSKIATYLPGRTDNEIKNFWNTHMRKKLHRPRTDHDHLNQLLNLSQLIFAAQLNNLTSPLQNLLFQTLNTSGLMGSQSSLYNLAAPIPETYQSEGSISQTSSDECDQGQRVDQSPDVSDFQTDKSMPISLAWEKLMDDESDSSCWKDILDLTSWPSSPIEW